MKYRKLGTSETAKRVFTRVLDASGDYRRACEASGVSARTGRRWRAQIEAARRSTPDVWLPPCAPTSFVGRQAELEALSSRFRTRERLLNVTGPPGIGKTRLVVEWLRQNRAHFSDDQPPNFCDLRRAKNDGDLIAAVAEQLGVQLHVPAAAAAPALCRILRARGKCLLILDNFEQLAQVAAPIIAQWLRAAPELQVWVTSRQRLHLQAEVILEVGSLGFPRSEHDSIADADLSADATNPSVPWLETDAVKLFCARAATHGAHAEPGHRELRTVAAVVRALDGVPLAIELAAARLRHRTVDEVLAEMQSSVLSFKSQSRDADPRDRSLAASIERSWSLLDSAEQSMLGQLSVFRNGFSLEAAETVVAIPNDDHPIRARLVSLREASLVRTAETDRGQRWDLYESIRQFARDRSREMGVRDAARRRHAAYYRAYAERSASQFFTERSDIAHQELRVELENLRGALTYLLPEGARNSRSLLALARALRTALASSMPWVAIDVATAALDATRDSAPGHLDRVALLIGRATARREVGDGSAADDDLAMASAQLDALRDEAATAEAPVERLSAEIAYERGLLHIYRGEGPSARAQLEAALMETQAFEASHLKARIHLAMAWVLAEIFRDPTAFNHHPRAVELMRTAGDRHGERYARWLWAIHKIFFSRSDSEAAIREWQATADRFGSAEHRIFASAGRVIQSVQAKRFDEAEAHARRARQIAAHTGFRRWEAGTTLHLGLALDMRGEPESLCKAGAHYEEGLASFHSLKDRRYEALAAIYLAGVRARTSDWEDAEHLLVRAGSLLRDTGDWAFKELVELQRAHFDLRHARLADRHQGRNEWTRHVRRARMRLARASRESGPGHLPLMDCCMQARIVAFVIDRELARFDREQHVLRLADDMSWYSLRAEPLRTLPEGDVLRRVLRVIVEASVSTPGTPVPAADILERAWPGERMLPEAGVRRIRDVINRLRRSGLRDVVMTGPDGGYMIMPSTRVYLDPVCSTTARI